MDLLVSQGFSDVRYVAVFDFFNLFLVEGFVDAESDVLRARLSWMVVMGVRVIVMAMGMRVIMVVRM